MNYTLTEAALEIQEEKKDNNFFLPKRGTDGSAGFDFKICSTEPITIFPGEYHKLPTGVKLWLGSAGTAEEIDDDLRIAALLLPRSSLKGLQLTNSVGLIDQDYQGEYLVSVYNYTNEVITLPPLISIVQVVIFCAYTPELIFVPSFAEETTRSEGGFGSTNA